jgi:hypothetical protein
MFSFLSNFNLKKVFDKNKNLLGHIVWVIFDTDHEKIIWFVYKKTFLKYDFFLIQDILENDSDIVIKDWNTEKIDNYYDLIWKQVKNIDDKNLWIIHDIEFDITYKLKNLILDGGYDISSVEFLSPTKLSIKKNYIKISKKAILSYKKDFVLVDDNALIKENKKTFEKISEIFINITNPSYNINK